jgi:diguanylate cyclase (GGDEF)-like protein
MASISTRMRAPNVTDRLRRQITRLLVERRDSLTAGTVRFVCSDDDVDPDSGARLSRLLVQLLEYAVRDSQLDTQDTFVAELRRIALQQALSTAQLFTFVYLAERTALDQLAMGDAIGTNRKCWPLVEQAIRRASFDVIAAYVHGLDVVSTAGITDRLTTLYTRPIFDAALAKELERARRFGHHVSLILFDVDRLSDVNREHGHGVGDRILERLGVLIRQYFRQHDWVALHSEDSIGVLLSYTDGATANELAERVRTTVEQRLAFTDRTNRPVTVTVSAAVVHVPPPVDDAVSPGSLMAEAETAVRRAKGAGRNRVERCRPSGGAFQGAVDRTGS